ncbi:quinoprotein dehydrogenase-associated SoxYZ-like carrier [Neomegalonema sp.]|uniref:quinoprotein dehydrogenase-associated SoxYZ-like carrier n=1 Tax=Neomegalonema sp. TaxID=2039713 RepID=UPI00261F84B4|nr:quinoprotein dehydrogenase-associated SoxYZ-like carrier [Neomegalonema sp.]MDD2867544.1 quinoprotein dehydrogenase-associated SoxYZ-like carrier [Neomegalonema sp.]
MLRIRPPALGAVLAFAALSAAPASAQEIPPDPLKSGMWELVAEENFPGEIVFDPRVKLSLPAAAEDQFHVPVTIDARALAAEIGPIEEMVVAADLNPIIHAVTFRPGEKAEPFLGLRIKVEQTTPVRVGVRGADGIWRVAAAVIDAAGGGCSAPAAAHGQKDWMSTLGEARALASRSDAGETRLSFRMRHPMDTGFAAGVPIFHLGELSLTLESGEELAGLEISAPISEDPTFNLLTRPSVGGAAVSVAARDSEGNRFAFSIPLPGEAVN